MAVVPGGLRLRKVRTQALSGQEPSSDGGTGVGGDDSSGPVSPVGRLFLDKGFYTEILCALQMERRMELQHLRDVLGQTLGHHPRFHSRVDMEGTKKSRGKPVWVPVELDMVCHVKEMQPTSEELAHPESALGLFMGRLLSLPPLDPFRPRWEAYLLHAPMPGAECACVLRMHHCLGDGISLMSLLLACTRQTLDPTLLPNLPGAPRARLPAPQLLSDAATRTTGAGERTAAGDGAAPQARMPSEESSETLSSMAAAEGLPASSGKVAAAPGRRPPWGPGWASVRSAALVAYNTLRHMSHFTAVVGWLPDTPNAMKSNTSEYLAPKAIVITPPFPLTDISAIRKAVGATVNDVMITILTLAVEKYLERHGAGGAPLPRRPQITAVGLVNLRRAPGLRELSELMAEDSPGSASSGNRAPWGNHLGTYLLPLPVSPFSGDARKAGKGHAVDRLLAVKRMCDSKKLSLEAHCTYLSGRVVMALSGPKGASAMLGRLMSQTTLSVSNVLGPVEQVSLGGVPLTAILPSAPPPIHALCCHFQSYNGQLNAILYMCRKTFTAPEEVSGCFVDAFQELKSSLCS